MISDQLLRKPHTIAGEIQPVLTTTRTKREPRETFNDGVLFADPETRMHEAQSTYSPPCRVL